MKKLLVILAMLMFIGCAGPQNLVFDGSVKTHPPDYMTYAGEGYGYEAIHPIGGMGGL